MQATQIAANVLLSLILIICVGTLVIKLVKGPQGSWFNIPRTKGTTSSIYIVILALLIVSIVLVNIPVTSPTTTTLNQSISPKRKKQVQEK